MPEAGAPIAIGFVCSAGAAPGAATIANGGVVPPSSTIVTQPCAAPRSTHAPARPGVAAADHGGGGDPGLARAGRRAVDRERERRVAEARMGVDGRQALRLVDDLGPDGEIVAGLPAFAQ